MPPEDPAKVLNRLLELHCRSFPQYLRYCRPHTPAGRGEVVTALELIVEQQDTIADRIAQAVAELGAPPRPGDFPMEFTDTHDLDVDFVLSLAIRYQQQDVDAIAGLVGQLQTLPAAKSLAEEALGMAKGHLRSLHELIPAGAG